MDRQMDMKTERVMLDGQIDKQSEGGWTDRQTDEWMDRQTNTLMGGQKDKYSDWRMDR